METGGQGSNFHDTGSQFINTEDSEFWINSGAFVNSLAETSPAMIQSAERRKRQNCGHSLYGQQRMFGGPGQIEVGSDLSMAAEENVNHSYGPLFAGVQGWMTQGNRQHARTFEHGGPEAGTRSFPSFSSYNERATKSHWNAVPPGSEEGTSQHSAGNLAGNFTNSFHPYMRDESRHSYKRKSSMDNSVGSLTSRASSSQRENDFAGFVQVSGSRITSLIPAYDESQPTRECQYGFQCPRTGEVHYAQNERANRFDHTNPTRPQENFQSLSTVGGVPPQGSIPRRMGTTVFGSVGNMGIGLPEVLPFRQGTALSANGTWCANNTFVEDGGFNIGNQTRHSLTEALGVPSADSRLSQHPPNRVSRAIYSREFNPHASHQAAVHNPYVHGGTVDVQPYAISAGQPLSRYNNAHHQGSMLRFPVSASPAALNSISQAAYGEAYPSFASGQAIPPPRYNDTNRWPYVHPISLRGHRALSSEGMNRHRFAETHEFFNQSLIYGNGDFADINDQHSNMRLDVDNMSYEELLALEERIGNVNTGLSEDNLDKCLKTSTYSCSETTSEGNSQESDLKCSICQEEYMEGDELGQLDCGHGYHTACIKQWLLLKNQCPICKAAACSKSEDNLPL